MSAAQHDAHGYGAPHAHAHAREDEYARHHAAQPGAYDEHSNPVQIMG